MTDIVTRLRQQYPETPYHRDGLHREAADEIARLKGENAVLRGLLSQCANFLIDCSPEDPEEGYALLELRDAIDAALEPVKGDLL